MPELNLFGRKVNITQKEDKYVVEDDISVHYGDSPWEALADYGVFQQSNDFDWYPIVVTKEADTWYGISPDHESDSPYQGDTLQECLENAYNAIRLDINGLQVYQVPEYNTDALDLYNEGLQVVCIKVDYFGF